MDPLATLLSGDQSRFDEKPHVVGDGRLGDVEGCGEVADARSLADVCCHKFEQLEARRIREGFEFMGQVARGRRIKVRQWRGRRARGGVSLRAESGRSCHALSIPFTLTFVYGMVHAWHISMPLYRSGVTMRDSKPHREQMRRRHAAAALSRSEYLDGLSAAGFIDIEARNAPGMHVAIIQARTLASPLSDPAHTALKTSSRGTWR